MDPMATSTLPRHRLLLGRNPQNCPIDCGSICCMLTQHCSSTSTCDNGPAPVDGEIFTSTSRITRTATDVVTSVGVFTSSRATGTPSVVVVEVPFSTFRPSGTNTFVVPIPSSSDLGDGGIIGGGGSGGRNDPPSAAAPTTATVVGVTIAGCVGVALLLFVLFWLLRRRRRRRAGGGGRAEQTLHYGKPVELGGVMVVPEAVEAPERASPRAKRATRHA
ncbi:hypothetical protein BZA05DRAFT_175222 [Tricharina praecox]|uniref:uncharacterized protein n=1 Tax=Tricharina praecox TaxID=43433 RepID=UPI00221FE5DD|nr:uncharacterized protein BZA05DRAFT_175222 [Tricharina praecox]KAI5844090.1 hypothetical protein BZA05DRAFT_175222 [Tricharina praecox]